jgi:diaminohydroxyphosphoribosylaminopyrimidine deaminase/5-amino-6-(5-phosphoribosylamino)uracil reductase
MTAVSPADADLRFLRRAIELSQAGRGRAEPNPLVGAVVVRDGRVIGEGFHQRFGGPHAEMEALAACRESPAGATVYVTLEPCCHHGKTPPCTDALIAAKVARVVFAVIDPFPKVAGGGRRALEAAGIAVECGLLAEEAVAANAPYFKRLALGRPYVIAKWAQTATGELVLRDGVAGGAESGEHLPRWISNETSRRRVHELRDRVDAILIGIGTALADDPRLTTRLPDRAGRNPRRFVLDAACRLPIRSKTAQTARQTPTTVVCAAAGEGHRRVGDGPGDRLASAGVELLPLAAVEGKIDLGELLDALGRREITNLLVEGGPTVLSSFFAGNLVDEVELFIAGPGGSRPVTPSYPKFPDLGRLAALPTTHIESLDGDIHLTARLSDPRAWMCAKFLGG